jgi:hypothetical protein
MSDDWAQRTLEGRGREASRHSPVVRCPIAVIILSLKLYAPKVPERLDHAAVAIMRLRKSAATRKVDVRLLGHCARVVSCFGHVDVCVPGPQAAVARWRRLRRADWWRRWRRVRWRWWTGRRAWRQRWQRRRARRGGWHRRRWWQYLAPREIDGVIGCPDALARCGNAFHIVSGGRLEHIPNLVAGNAWVKVPHHIAHPIVGERVLAKVLIAISRLAATGVARNTVCWLRIEKCGVQRRDALAGHALYLCQVILAIVDSIADCRELRDRGGEPAHQQESAKARHRSPIGWHSSCTPNADDSGRGAAAAAQGEGTTKGERASGVELCKAGCWRKRAQKLLRVLPHCMPASRGGRKKRPLHVTDEARDSVRGGSGPCWRRQAEA